jgi:hypothetical protein
MQLRIAAVRPIQVPVRRGIAAAMLVARARVAPDRMGRLITIEGTVTAESRSVDASGRPLTARA